MSLEQHFKSVIRAKLTKTLYSQPGHPATPDKKMVIPLKKVLFLSLKSVFEVNRPDLTRPGPARPSGFYEGLFLSQFKIYKLETIAQIGYRFQNCHIKI